MGPNGAGKSTLLRGLLRTTPIHAGHVQVFGESTSSMTRRQLARLLAFVPASHEVAFSISVREMVAMGRSRITVAFSHSTHTIGSRLTRHLRLLMSLIWQSIRCSNCRRANVIG